MAKLGKATGLKIDIFCADTSGSRYERELYQKYAEDIEKPGEEDFFMNYMRKKFSDWKCTVVALCHGDEFQAHYIVGHTWFTMCASNEATQWVYESGEVEPLDCSNAMLD